MGISFDSCLSAKKLIKIEIEPELIQSEMREAEKDLASAKKDYQIKDWKWATTKAYYSMFHAAKSLLYFKGFKERHSHACLIEGFKELYVKEGLLPLRFAEYLEAGKSRREDATYELVYSEEIASTYVRAAEEFVEKSKQLLAQHLG